MDEPTRIATAAAADWFNAPGPTRGSMAEAVIAALETAGYMPRVRKDEVVMVLQRWLAEG